MYTRIKNKIRRSFEKRSVALMYHRVTDLQIDPWQLAVSPANFEEQLQVLSQSFRVISTDVLLQQLQNNSIALNNVCITFDDGYKDNYLHAKPLLEKYGCPATFYIASHFIDKNKSYWWDQLETILLHSPKLPATFSIVVEEPIVFHLPHDGILTEEEKQRHSKWVWEEEPPTKRCEIYLQIWSLLKTSGLAKIETVLQELRLLIKNDLPVQEESLPMTSKELSSFIHHSLLGVGVHTVTHPALASLNKTVQQKEIAGCKTYFEKEYGEVLSTITYPHGNYNDDTIAVVKELQLKAGFTTEEKSITNNTDPYRIGRFQVKNWNGDEFEKQLYYWIKNN